MWLRALSKVLFVTVILGATVSVMCTGILTPRLWLSSAACWAFVPALQAFTGLVFLHTGRLTVPAFLDALFSTHRPWSLWYLGVAGLMLAWPQVSAFWFEMSAVIPLAFTFRLLVELSVNVSGLDRTVAIRRVAAHQVATVLLILCTQAAAILPRAIGLFEQWR